MSRIDTRPAHSLDTGAVLRAFTNLVVLILFALLAFASIRHFAVTGTVKSFGILIANSLFVGLFLFRKQAKAEATAPTLWLLSLAGTALPLLMRPTEGGLFTIAGNWIQFAGIMFVVAGLLSLRRSFAIVPANRGIQVDGMYRFVRHPLYSAELLLFLGVALANPSVLNWSIWIIECGLQFARARIEERFLSEDPDYRSYLERVRYRLVPGLL